MDCEKMNLLTFYEMRKEQIERDLKSVKTKEREEYNKGRLTEVERILHLLKNGF